MAELVTKSEFARRKGVTPQAIDGAIKSQRIGVTHDGKGRPRLDFEIASEQWDKTARARVTNAQPKAAATITEEDIEEAEAGLLYDGDDDENPDAQQYFINRAVTEKYKAKRERQKYFQEKGELVRADDVKMAWTKITGAVKTRVQAIPAKVKIAIPRLTVDEMETLDDMIQESLSEIADWKLGDA